MEKNLGKHFLEIFVAYYNSSKEELVTGFYCSYSLNQSYCRFTVAFEKMEFYEFLMNELIKRSLSDNWTNFMQCYDYDNSDNCIFSLYSTRVSQLSIGKFASSVKKNGLLIINDLFQ